MKPMNIQPINKPFKAQKYPKYKSDQKFHPVREQFTSIEACLKAIDEWKQKQSMEGLKTFSVTVG
jgi:hypothetical protein